MSTPHVVSSPSFARAASLAAWLLLATACGPEATPDLEFHRGVNALDDERADAARRHFAAHLEVHPDAPEAWRLAGDAWMSGMMRSPGEATAHWRRYLELQPDDQDVVLRLVDTLLLDGDWQAAELWSARLDERVASQMARANLLMESDPEAAGPILASLVAEEPDHRGVDALAARFHYAEGDWARATVHAERAVAADPFDLPSRYLLARLLRRQGSAAGAEAQLAIHDRVSRLKGAAGTSTPTSNEALALLEALAAQVPTDGLAFQMEWLRALVADGDRGAAKQRLTTLVSRPELTAPLRMELAGLADQLGDAARARQLLQEVYDEASLGSANRRRAHYGLAVLAYRARDAERLEALVKDGLAAFPFAAGFWHLRGRMALNRDDADGAARALRAAVHLAPWRSDFRMDLANLWLSQGQLEAVRALLAEAPGDDPTLAAYRRENGLDDGE